MKKIKVLHLLKSNHFSGAENVIFQIINMFRDDNFEMTYCSRDGQIREALEEANIKFCPIKELNIKEVKRVVSDYKPDIIHAHDVSASVIASYFGSKYRVISHIHGNHESMSKTNLRTILYLLCSTRFKHIFWVSNSSFDGYRFKNRISGKSSILSNVMNRAGIINRANQDYKIYDYDVVYIGRISYPKNPQRLMTVLKLVIELNPNIKIAIVGTGDLLDGVKKISKELGTENNISFLGFQSNPLKVLNDSKVMVMTSRFEGTPMCALEAMALGVPIVTTPTDGLIDLIDDNVEGYLSEDNSRLAEKIVEIVENKDIHDRLSENTVKKFLLMNDLQQYKQEILDAYISDGGID